MVDEKSIIFVVIAGTMVMFVLMLAIIMFVILYNRKLVAKENEHNLSIKDKELEMLRSVIEAQENEREKIARNLHDEVGPLLSALKLNISRFKRLLQKEKLTEETLDQERTFIDGIIDNVRTVSHDLSPQFLLKFGYIKALQNYLEPITDINIEFNPQIDDSVLSKQKAINLYRISLELINNLLKHDKPTNLKINLLVDNETLLLKLDHDGTGINNQQFEDFAKNATGLGLTSMQSRVLIVNGNLNFHNTPTAVIELRIPLNGQSN
jgi:signal transduction histidine kinase